MSIKLNRKGAGLAGEDRVKENQNLEMIEKGFNTVESTVNNAQKQINNLVVQGDSSPQAIQASVGVDGTDYGGSLKARLDAEQKNLERELSKKRPDTGVVPINYAEWDNETKQKVTGGSVAVIGPNSAGRDEIVMRSVDESKTSFVAIASNNLANPDKIRYGGYYAENAANLGEWIPIANFHSIIIPTDAGGQYPRNSTSSVVHFNVSWKPVSGSIPSGQVVTIPQGVAYTAFNFHTPSTARTQINKGSKLLDYDDFKLAIPRIKINESNIDPNAVFKGTVLEGVKLVPTENLFNKNSVSVGYFDGNGNYVNDVNYRVHSPIPVKEGQIFRSLTPGHRALRNEAGQWVGSLAGSGNLRIPSGLGVKTIQPISTVGNLQLEMFVEGTVYPSYYIPFEKYSLDAEKYDLKQSTSPIYRKKWAGIGDSNTFASYSYLTQISTKYSMDATNHGLNGRSIARRGGQTDVDIPPVVDVISAVATTNEIITVMAGVNDYHSQVPLGSEDSTDVTTFNGALNSIAKQLIERFPGKKIAFMTPYQRKDSTVVRAITLPMYVETIKKAAARFGIPCFDLYANCGLYPNISIINTTYYADADGSGLHPNAAGHGIAVPKIAAFLETL